VISTSIILYLQVNLTYLFTEVVRLTAAEQSVSALEEQLLCRRTAVGYQAVCATSFFDNLLLKNLPQRAEIWFRQKNMGINYCLISSMNYYCFQ